MKRFRFKAIQLIAVGLLIVPFGSHADFDQMGCAGTLAGSDGVVSRTTDVVERMKTRQKRAFAKRLSELGAVGALLTNLGPALGKDVSQSSYYERLRNVLPFSPKMESDLVVSEVVGETSDDKSLLFGRMLRSATGESEFDTRVPDARQTHVIMSRASAHSGEPSLLNDARARYAKASSASSDDPLFTFRLKLDELENLAFVDVGNPEATDGRAMAHPADVLFVLIDDKTVDDVARLEAVRDVFGLHGQRPIVLVMRTNRFGAADLDLIKHKLNFVGRVLYGADQRLRREDLQNAREGVLGLYVMPIEGDGPHQRSTSDLIALEGSLQFDALIQSISDRSVAIRSFPVKSAGRLVHAEIKDDVRALFRRHYLTKIYGQMMQAAMLVPPKPEQFPFDKINMLLLKLFAQERPILGRVLSAAEGVLIHGARQIMGVTAAETDLEKYSATFSAAVQRSWMAHLTQIRKDISKGEVRVPAAQARAINAMVSRFNGMFPEAPLEDIFSNLIDLTGERRVRLPNLGGLVAANQEDPRQGVLRALDKHLDAMTKGSDTVTTHVELTEGFLRQGVVAYIQGDYKNGLRKIHRIRSTAKYIMPALTKGAARTVEVVAVKTCIQALGATVGCLINTAFYYKWERQLIHDLDLKLNGWLADKQIEAFARMTKDLISQPLRSSLNGTIREDQEEAIDSVRSALEAIGVETNLDYPWSS